MHAGGTAVSAYVHLVDPNKHWYNNKRIIILNIWILLLLTTSLINSYDGNIIYSFQSLPQWTQYFNLPSGGTRNLLNSMRTIGSLAALPIAPYVADGLGRRTSVFIGALALCIATAFQTGSNSLGMFICARFLIGFGLTFATIGAPMLIAEIAYPTYRAPLTSAYGSLWYSGAIAAGWSTFGAANITTTWSWRLPSILQLIPSVLQVALIWFGPESPRWLISKNRDVEALEILAYYHADGHEDDPLVVFEYDQIKTAIDREVAANKVGWKTLFTTPEYHKRLSVLFFLAFASPWYAYPLKKALIAVSITNPKVQLLINGSLQIWNLFWALLAASSADRVGRRFLFLTSIAGMVIFYSLQTASSAVYVKTGHQSAAYAFVVFIFLFYSFFNLAFPTLIISYSVEVLPYSLRAKGFTYFSFTVCLAIFFGQYVHLPIGLGPFDWNIVYVAVLVGQGIFLWIFIIETKDHTLEEAGTLFDGDGTTGTIEHVSKEGDPKPSPICHEYIKD